MAQIIFSVDFKERSLQATVYDSLSEIPFAQWPEWQGQRPVPMTEEYLRAVDAATPANVQQQCLFLTEGKELLCVALLQRVDIMPKLDTKDIRRILRFIGLYKPNKGHRLLVAGSLFFSGEYALQYNAARINKADAYCLLAEASMAYANSLQDIELVVLKDFYEENRAELESLKEEGWHFYDGDPCMQLELKSDWKSFADYTDAITSKYRKRLNAVYKNSAVLQVEELSLVQMQQQQQRLEELLQNVQSKAKFKLADANVEYLLALKEQLGEGFIVTGYFFEEQLVGFSSAVLSSDVLEAHFIGVDYQLNTRFDTYQRILYQYVQQAIDKGIPLINYGRTAMEIKSTIGAIPKAATIVLKHSSCFLNWAIPPAFKMIPQEEWVQRSPFKSA